MGDLLYFIYKILIPHFRHFFISYQMKISKGLGLEATDYIKNNKHLN